MKSEDFFERNESQWEEEEERKKYLRIPQVSGCLGAKILSNFMVGEALNQQCCSLYNSYN